jgi:cell division control protein 24
MNSASYSNIPPTLVDPVSILWNTFKLGAPLCMIYNQSLPRNLLNVSDVSSVRPPEYKKVCKDNVYHFILACKNEMNIKEASEFSISELYKDDTHGFVKVLKMVQIIMDKIEMFNLMPPSKPLPFTIPTQDTLETPQDNRSKLIKELIDTERSYIESLEALSTYEKEGILNNVFTKVRIHLYP